MIWLRYATRDDAEELFTIFHTAVHGGTMAFYSPEERQAWAPSPSPSPSWPDRLTDQLTIVADSAIGPRGFMTLGWDGHLDLAYVHPSEMGRGIASKLHEGVLFLAQDLGLKRLTTEASHLARRFFLKHGWREQAEQVVERQRVRIVNFRMERDV